MIDRYAREKMKSIWTLENQFNTYLKVELASLEALSELGVVPLEDFNSIKDNAKVDVKRIQELEQITKHDVIAFTRQITESKEPFYKWFHYGLTSTDVVDSANMLRLKQANDIILQDFLKLQDELKNKALAYKNTPIIGRTHGMHGEITSYGLKFLSWYDESIRCLENFKLARKNLEVIQLSGPMGNYTVIPFEVEQIAAHILDMDYAKISTQVLSRDRITEYIMSLANMASLLEKIAVEIRHLSRTEISEVQESFSQGQKGSSAMPHKKNPISSENICGLSRIVRSYVSVAMENNILWHERDISHSSAERIIFEDVTELMDYMLVRYTNVLHNLVSHTEKMKENIYMTYGIVFSGRVLEKCIDKGMDRNEAYDMVQELTFQAYQSKTMFQDVLRSSKLMSLLTEEDLQEAFDESYFLRNVEKIYQRFDLI